MAEQLVIHCDKCMTRIPRRSRTRIKWGREPSWREPTDLCPDCVQAVLEALGMAPPEPPLPLLDAVASTSGMPTPSAGVSA